MEEKDSSVDKPEEEESDQPELRKISREELEKVLEAHQKWLESEGKEGVRAELHRTNLQGADLSHANLRGVVLRGADLFHTNLREANLQDADLAGVRGLLVRQLAGANVSGAKLPREIQKFEDDLQVVEEASKNARKLFFSMLLGCVYSLLTIVTTNDVLLLTNSASSPLPIIGTKIPIVCFYIVAPLILLSLYLHFHLYMQRLWEELVKLPAIFPDGRSLDQNVSPWLLTGLVRIHLPQLQENRPPLSHIQDWLARALAWWFMPGTLFFFWLRYLHRQDWFWTTFHIAILVVAIWAGIMFYRLAVATLHREERELLLWKNLFKEVTTYKRVVVAVICGMIPLLLSLGTINGARAINASTGRPEFLSNDLRTWVPYVCERFGFSPFANFREKDVSQKPPNWTGLNKDEIYQVKGASLDGRNLRYADAYRAFLIKANLRGTDLSGARLRRANLQIAKLKDANLQKANLSRAILKGANLGEAKLQEAILRKAYLQKAHLKKAKLQKACLYLAKLQEADLRYANLQGADLRYANLEEARLRFANLEGADLRGAKYLTVKQLSGVETLYQAELDRKLKKHIEKYYPHLRKEPKEEK